MVKITLFGLAGVGTSTVAKLFSTKNSEYKFKSGGDIFREMAKEKNLDVYEFNQLCQSDKKYDLELDDKIKEFGENNSDFIFESRMAWNFIPDSIKIKLICDDEIRIKRICEREKIDFNNNEEFNKIKDKTFSREKSEMFRYQKYYNIENYTDDNNFDLIIDTTNLTPEEIILKIESFCFN